MMSQMVRNVIYSRASATTFFIAGVALVLIAVITLLIGIDRRALVAIMAFPFFLALASYLFYESRAVWGGTDPTISVAANQAFLAHPLIWTAIAALLTILLGLLLWHFTYVAHGSGVAVAIHGYILPIALVGVALGTSLAQYFNFRP